MWQRLRYDLDRITATSIAIVMTSIVVTVIVLSRVCGHVEDWDL